MRAVHRACLLLALIVSGCASYQPQPISPDASARALDSRTLDDPRLLRFIDAALKVSESPQRAERWDLGTLTLAALYYHPDMDLARGRLAAARAGTLIASQIPNPSGEVGLSYNRTTTVPSPWTVGLMVNFIIETFGRRQYRQEQAASFVDAAREDLVSATWQVRGRVREALLAIWLAERRVALARERLSRQEVLVRLIERRFELGGASALEVSRERINRNEASLALSDAQRLASQGRAQLALAIGVPLRALEETPLNFEVFDRPEAMPAGRALANLRDAALIKRSDVRAMLADYAAAQSALQLQVASQFPNLVLGPGYTYDQGDHKYQLTASGELPVFNQNQGAIALAEARRAETAARFTALQAQIIAAIDSAATTYDGAAQALGTAEKLRADAQQRETVIQRRFDAGDVDRPTLLTAQIELFLTEIARLDALGAQRRAIGALEDGLRVQLLDEKVTLPSDERNPRTASGEPR